MDTEKFNSLRKGLLEFLILNMVSSGRVYVADMLQRLGGTDFATQEGTLYPLLSRMRRDQLLDYEWQESDSGPPRKYYRISKLGKAAQSELLTQWKDFNKNINSLLKAGD